MRMASHDGNRLTGRTSMVAVCAVLFEPIRPRRRFRVPLMRGINTASSTWASQVMYAEPLSHRHWPKHIGGDLSLFSSPMAARLRMRMHSIVPKPRRSSRSASHALSKPWSLLATCTYVRQEGRMRVRLMRVPRATQQPRALLSCIFARLRGCDRRAAVHRGQRPPQWHSDSIASTAPSRAAV